MALLGPKEQEIVRERLANLTRDVELVLFTDTSTLIAPGKEPCLYCKETKQLLEELAALSDRLHLVVYDLATPEGKEKAKEYRVEDPPTLILREKGSEAINLRYRGIPAGYEFASLLEDIEMLGRDGHGLPENVVQELNNLPEEVMLQVFVTPHLPLLPAGGAHRPPHGLRLPQGVGRDDRGQRVPRAFQPLPHPRGARHHREPRQGEDPRGPAPFPVPPGHPQGGGGERLT